MMVPAARRPPPPALRPGGGGECRCSRDRTDYGQVYVFGESKGMGLGSPNGQGGGRGGFLREVYHSCTRDFPRRRRSCALRTSGRTPSPGAKVFSPKLVKGMEGVNVLEVVSGLHHTMIIAELAGPRGLGWRLCPAPAPPQWFTLGSQISPFLPHHSALPRTLPIHKTWKSFGPISIPLKVWPETGHPDLGRRGPFVARPHSPLRG